MSSKDKLFVYGKVQRPDEKKKAEANFACSEKYARVCFFVCLGLVARSIAR